MSNFLYNRQLWNEYAARWDKAALAIENAAVSPDQRDAYIQFLGDEWGRKEDVDAIVEGYILPYVTNDSDVAEIGVGGGRLAARVAPRIRQLYCFDIAVEMLTRAESALRDHRNVQFVLLETPDLGDRFTAYFDFVYSFDVFVHLDLHLMWRYFSEVARVLKEGCRAFVHTTNLGAPAGWERFARQDAYSVEGHYFVSPEIVGILARHAGLRIVKTSDGGADNSYLNRDYLVVLQKCSER